MAKSTPQRRQKLVFRLAQVPPRNPFAVAARGRKAGQHTKSSSARRAIIRATQRKLEGEDS